ncbi:MAG: hypothetical protein KGZ85_17245 [Ignavibacterium sp.]|nr:hypothetical protein [Ignavibacterium sp.]
MEKSELIKNLYSELNESEKYGLQFALFPLCIHQQMQQHNITAVDLIKHDEKVRAERNERTINNRNKTDTQFDDDFLMSQYDERTELEDE